MSFPSHLLTVQAFGFHFDPCQGRFRSWVAPQVPYPQFEVFGTPCKCEARSFVLCRTVKRLSSRLVSSVIGFHYHGVISRWQRVPSHIRQAENFIVVVYHTWVLRTLPGSSLSVSAES